MNIDFFTNDRFKVLSCMQQRQVDILGNQYVPLSQRQIAEITGIGGSQITQPFLSSKAPAMRPRVWNYGYSIRVVDMLLLYWPRRRASVARSHCGRRGYAKRERKRSALFLRSVFSALFVLLRATGLRARPIVYENLLYYQALARFSQRRPPGIGR